jgi:hypothetical protein
MTAEIIPVPVTIIHVVQELQTQLPVLPPPRGGGGKYDSQRHVGKKYEKGKRKKEKKNEKKKRKKKNSLYFSSPVGVGVTNLINVSRGVQIRRDKDCIN